MLRRALVHRLPAYGRAKPALPGRVPPRKVFLTPRVWRAAGPEMSMRADWGLGIEIRPAPAKPAGETMEAPPTWWGFLEVERGVHPEDATRIIRVSDKSLVNFS